MYLCLVRIKTTIFLILLSVFTAHFFSQNGFNLCRLESAKVANKADYEKICQNLSRNNFLEAEKHIQQTLATDTSNKVLKFLLGVCNSYNFEKIKNSISNIVASKTPSLDLYNYHLGYAYQVNDSINTAQTYYKKELKIQEIKPAKDKQLIELVKLRIEQCENLATIKNASSKSILVNALVTIDNVPSNSEVEVRGLAKFTNFKLRLNTKGLNGNFICHLPIGDKYEFTFKTDKLPPQIIELNTEKIDTVTQTNLFINFISPEFDKKIATLIENTNKVVNNKNFKLDQFAAKYGAVNKPDLYYKVQVGAFKFFENFSYSDALEFPKIIRQTDNDYITRFTMGNYTTYNEAVQLLNRVHEHKVKDAFVIAIYKGQKKYLHQLVAEKIITN